MVGETVDIWIENLLEEHGYSSLGNVPDNILFDTIKEAEANVQNCMI